MIDIEKLQSKEIIQFINNYEGNPHDLLLRSKLFDEIDNKELAIQIEGMRTMTKKFSFLADHPRFVYPPKLSLEQASSEETARYKSSLVQGNRLLDLTGGMGIDMVCMALNFEHLVYVDPNEHLCEIAAHNIPLITNKPTEIHNVVASEYLASLSSDVRFDWIYIDPSRRQNGNRLTQLEDLSPNVVDILPDLQKHGKNIMIKLSPMQHLSECWDRLPGLSAIHLISVDRELKEVLLLITENTDQNIICAVHHKGTLDVHHFERHTTAQIEYSDPQNYLYIPDPSLMKGDVHRQYAMRHHLSKIHPNTHLYTCNKVLSYFPGRVYKVQFLSPLKKKLLRSKISTKKANAIARNFPLKPKEILKKIGFVEGGNDYLIAFTDIKEQKLIAHCVNV